MKVCILEHPRSYSSERCNDIANAPLSACLMSGYIAACLVESGHDTHIIEGYLEKLDYSKIYRQIRGLLPDLLAVHLVYNWESNLELYNFLKLVKDEGLAGRIAVFGYYPTFAFEEILTASPYIDCAVLGEPELTMLELAQDPELNCVEGLAYRGADGMTVSSRRPLIDDLDALPFPIRTQASLGIGEVNIAGSRGCYGGCTFCYINPFYGCGKWRPRSPESIRREIVEIIDKTGCRDFYFTDPNFFGPGERGQKRALELASLLKPLNIRFGLEARVNDIHEETVSALRDAGFYSLLIGLESGNAQSLERMNKMTTVEQNERALKILRLNGIDPNVGFIMFEPDSRLDDIRCNLEFLKRNRLLERLVITVNLLYHHLIILQGTKAYAMMSGQSRLELSQHSAYEATTTYSNPAVRCLASVMREVTNHVFGLMDGVWSGTVLPGPDFDERCGRANRRILEFFEASLTALERGGEISAEDILPKLTSDLASV